MTQDPTATLAVRCGNFLNRPETTLPGTLRSGFNLRLGVVRSVGWGPVIDDHVGLYEVSQGALIVS